MIYQLYRTSPLDKIPNAATTVGTSPQVSFLFDPSNTDYQQFKLQINADEAELQDAEGNLMSADEAKLFVKELP